MQFNMEIEVVVNVTNRVLSPSHQYETDYGGGSQVAASITSPLAGLGGLSMPLPETVLTLVFLSVITVSTIVGNVLVILSVFTYKPLRIAQNFFLVSLAVADLTVAVLVMPFNILHTMYSRWIFGSPLCQMWLTCDVLCCTASILNLCAIALDRYWAIHDPINYAQKRTLKRVVIMIVLVWIISGVICLPPVFGWNNWSHEFNDVIPCKLTDVWGYVIYSSCGSFFIPLAVMTTVYVKIFLATKRRLRERNRRAGATAATTSTTTALQHPYTPAASAAPGSGSSGKFSATGGGGGGGASVVATVVVTPATKSNGSSGSGSKTPSTPDKSTPSFGGVSGRLSPPRLREANHNDSDCREGFLDPGARDDPSSVADDVTVTVVELHHLHKADSNTSQCCKRKLDSSSPIHQFVIERQKISLSKERRAARILGIVMGVFMVCWLPFFTMYVVIPFCPGCKLPDWLENAITWLGYVNSALNPVIYTIFNVDFRRAFVRLLRCPSHGRRTRR